MGLTFLKLLLVLAGAESMRRLIAREWAARGQPLTSVRKARRVVLWGWGVGLSSFACFAVVLLTQGPRWLIPKCEVGMVVGGVLIAVGSFAEGWMGDS
jgi:hypothetical protein